MQIQKPSFLQEQRLKMSPQLLQSIKIMTLPLQELKERISEEIETNPALEIIEEKNDVSIDEYAEAPAESEFFENSSDPGMMRTGIDSESSDLKHKFMEGVLSRPESLQEHLAWQLRLQAIPEDFFQIGELLIRNLDENGFHREDPLELVPENQHRALDEVKTLIQGFDPAGTCTKDFTESLKVQLQQFEGIPPAAFLVIESHLQDLDRGKYKQISKALKISEEEVLEILDLLQKLTPFPGREFSSSTPQYVIPDVLVTKREGEFIIILNDEEIPVLGVNPFFDEVAKNDTGTPEQAKEAKQFVNKRIRDARWFINSINQRNQTMLKAVRALVEFQRDFFIRGPKYIVPLTLKDIANEIEVHEATVSRLANGKYIQTDFGVFEIRHFFTNAVASTSGDTNKFSKEGVKETLKEILMADSNVNLSDQKLSELLLKRGIKLARRTVAKYRKELDISSSYDR
jgi:RNA polymerase sigma-54 factor